MFCYYSLADTFLCGNDCMCFTFRLRARLYSARLPSSSSSSYSTHRPTTLPL